MEIVNLPVELLLQVFSCFSVEDLHHVMLVQRCWFDLIQEEQTLWKCWYSPLHIFPPLFHLILLPSPLSLHPMVTMHHAMLVQSCCFHRFQKINIFRGTRSCLIFCPLIFLIHPHLPLIFYFLLSDISVGTRNIVLVRSHKSDHQSAEMLCHPLFRLAPLLPTSSLSSSPSALS